MAQYIDKDALVAEIDKGINGRNDWQLDEYRKGYHDALTMLKKYLSTLKVKEIDLDDFTKEEMIQKYIDYTFKRYNIDGDSEEGKLIYYAYIHGVNQCLAKLRTQKEENI